MEVMRFRTWMASGALLGVVGAVSTLHHPLPLPYLPCVLSLPRPPFFHPFSPCPSCALPFSLPSSMRAMFSLVSQPVLHTLTRTHTHTHAHIHAHLIFFFISLSLSLTHSFLFLSPHSLFCLPLSTSFPLFSPPMLHPVSLSTFSTFLSFFYMLLAAQLRCHDNRPRGGNAGDTNLKKNWKGGPLELCLWYNWGCYRLGDKLSKVPA